MAISLEDQNDFKLNKPFHERKRFRIHLEMICLEWRVPDIQ